MRKLWDRSANERSSFGEESKPARLDLHIRQLEARADFVKPSLSDEEALEIDTLIPAETVWLGG